MEPRGLNVIDSFKADLHLSLNSLNTFSSRNSSFGLEKLLIMMGLRWYCLSYKRWLLFYTSVLFEDYIKMDLSKYLNSFIFFFMLFAITNNKKIILFIYKFYSCFSIKLYPKMHKSHENLLTKLGENFHQKHENLHQNNWI